MRYKKYLLMLILIVSVTFGYRNVYADAKYKKSCNYISGNNEFNATLTIQSGFDVGITHSVSAYTEVRVDKNGVLDKNMEKINNWYGGLGTIFEADTSKGGIKFDPIYKNYREANNDTNPSCPEYLVFQNCRVYRIWATNDKVLAENATNAINQTDGCKGYYAGHRNSDGSEITDEQYYSSFIDKEIEGEDVSGEITCDSLFGDKNDEKSIAYLINSVLSYVRIFVPILIILLGSLDLGKAVIASKEDEMKKAQTTFVKRLIAGMVIFFVPVFVNIIMHLADIVWDGMGYSVCTFK